MKEAPQCALFFHDGISWVCRLSHGVPSPTEAARIARKCPGLRELDATGCAQYLPESLQAFAQLPFQVGSACESLTGLAFRPLNTCLTAAAAIP